MSNARSAPQDPPVKHPEATRFERQVPWTPADHGPLHVAIWQFLATSSLIFGAWYLYWRWTVSLNWDAAWFALPLVVAETAAFFGLILFTINIWSPATTPRPPLPERYADTTDERDPPGRPIAVDVFFATYSEDPELVRLGLQDAKRLDYPYPIDIRIHVLDDGRRPAMAAVATQEGANYITRGDNVGYKAGNLRNAMATTRGDFVVICDADTRPFPNFLVETLGYFRDPHMAWVQTPQWFWDIPPGVPLPAWLGRRLGAPGRFAGRVIERLIGPVRFGEDPFANDPQLFYDFILRRRNWANASFCCGAGSVHRREALMQGAIRAWAEQVDRATLKQERDLKALTGEFALFDAVRDTARANSSREVDFTPFKLHVSEDIYTSIALHSDRVREWKSVMHPVIVSRMMSPNDLLSWTIQRFKYAGGTLDILRSDNPLFRKGLRPAQKVMYAATFYSYLAPLWNIIFITAPIVFLFTGIAPVASFSLDFFLHITPFLLLNELAQLFGLWGTDTMKGRRWYIAMFPLNLRALWAVVRGKRISFPVTPKDRAQGRFLRLVRWQILYLIATAAALIWGWRSFLGGAPGFSLGAIIANTVWSANNMLSLWPIVQAALWQPDPDYDLPVIEGYSHEHQ